MKRVTSVELNHAYADYLQAPEPGSSFWTLLCDYVTYVNFKVPLALRADLVQTAAMEIYRSLDKFKSGSDFAKWVNGIIFASRMDCFRHFYREKEWLLSGVDLPESHLDPEVPVDHFDTCRQLDVLAATLTGDNLRLFDLIRQGHTITAAADIMGQPFRTIQSRWERMRRKLTANCVLESNPSAASKGSYM